MALGARGGSTNDDPLDIAIAVIICPLFLSATNITLSGKQNCIRIYAAYHLYSFIYGLVIAANTVGIQRHLTSTRGCREVFKKKIHSPSQRKD